MRRRTAWIALAVAAGLLALLLWKTGILRDAQHPSAGLASTGGDGKTQPAVYVGSGRISPYPVEVIVIKLK